MENREKDHNVVPFPNLKQRILEKGMDAIKHKQFDEALDLLQQALPLEEQIDEVYLGIVVCLFELGHLEEAKEKCQLMLKQDIGDYYDVLQIYLTILIQLRKYDEVETTIEAVLQEGKIPSQTVENFYKLLDFSRKMTRYDDKENALIDVGLLVDDVSIADQWNIIQALRNEKQNISYAYQTLEEFLLDDTKHPLLKTAILEMYVEKGIVRNIKVEKFGLTMDVQTTELHEVPSHSFTLRVLQSLDQALGNENPSLFELVKDMWHRHLLVMYPFIPEPEQPNLWSAGLHKVGYDTHGIDVDLDELTVLYGITINDLLFSSSRIREIEEISYI
ncbi:tetratricopeptide repeat protein [Bacillus salitolerans]|uniref:Tetratricopeptide repeat protein n=1 Tax=Bacillus salitolerans TaxID=1437434 RepID=A0ABW4LLC5_9BACI